MTSWYSAKLLFETEVLAGNAEANMCEESIRLIEANDEADASQRASDVGIQAQHEYLNDEGKPVRWRFKGVLEIQNLCESHISHGMEVFSKMFHKT